MINSFNFWDKSKGTWTILSENNNFYRAIETAFKLLNDDVLVHKPNFNNSGDTLFLRTQEYCIRVSENWGQRGDCIWSLDRDQSEKYTIAKIMYSDLSVI